MHPDPKTYLKAVHAEIRAAKVYTQFCRRFHRHGRMRTPDAAMLDKRAQLSRVLYDARKAAVAAVRAAGLPPHPDPFAPDGLISIRRWIEEHRGLRARAETLQIGDQLRLSDPDMLDWLRRQRAAAGPDVAALARRLQVNIVTARRWLTYVEPPKITLAGLIEYAGSDPVFAGILARYRHSVDPTCPPDAPRYVAINPVDDLVAVWAARRGESVVPVNPTQVLCEIGEARTPSNRLAITVALRRLGWVNTSIGYAPHPVSRPTKSQD